MEQHGRCPKIASGRFLNAMNFCRKKNQLEDTTLNTEDLIKIQNVRRIGGQVLVIFPCVGGIWGGHHGRIRLVGLLGGGFQYVLFSSRKLGK